VMCCILLIIGAIVRAVRRHRILSESSGHTQSSKRVGNGVWIMKHLKKLEEEVSGWPHISVHPHRFAGREFRFLSAELGHVHTGGILDIPFPRSIHDALSASCLA